MAFTLSHWLGPRVPIDQPQRLALPPGETTREDVLADPGDAAPPAPTGDDLTQRIAALEDLAERWRTHAGDVAQKFDHAQDSLARTHQRLAAEQEMAARTRARLAEVQQALTRRDVEVAQLQEALNSRVTNLARHLPWPYCSGADADPLCRCGTEPARADIAVIDRGQRYGYDAAREGRDEALHALHTVLGELANDWDTTAGDLDPDVVWSRAEGARLTGCAAAVRAALDQAPPPELVSEAARILDRVLAHIDHRAKLNQRWAYLVDLHQAIAGTTPAPAAPVVANPQNNGRPSAPVDQPTAVFAHPWVGDGHATPPRHALTAGPAEPAADAKPLPRRRARRPRPTAAPADNTDGATS